MQAIDAIASGLEVRSKMSIEELSERFVWSFNKKMTEIKAECESTFKLFNEVKDDTHYYQNGRLFDKFNEYVRDYDLPFKTINIDDFGKNILETMSGKIDEMLEMLREERKKFKDGLK